MNERIKELAVQARNYALDEKRIYERIHNTEQCMEEYREVYNKKFAELIVQECQTVVEWAISVDSTINRVPVLIKEHFGVE
jgi:DNA integrity scanning protein DisA with diadenylate cyclase activity